MSVRSANDTSWRCVKAAVGAIGASSTGQAKLTIEIGTHADLAQHYPLQDLGHLANAEQAYQIATISDERIVICGHGPVGGFYGACTMAQLLSTPAGRRIHVPLLQVVDWPDINQRGLWNFPEVGTWIELNYGKMADTQLAPVQRGRRNAATIDVERMQRARRFGFEYLPYVLHLNFLHGAGLFRAYPELAGKGDRALAGHRSMRNGVRNWFRSGVSTAGRCHADPSVSKPNGLRQRCSH